MKSPYRAVSCGACGTHWLAQFMSQECGMGYPPGWQAHGRNPNLTAPPNNKILYLTADPFNTIISYRNRGFLNEPYMCMNLAGDCDMLNPVMGKGLLAFLENGQDPFHLQSHIQGWMNFKHRTYDLMVVKYEHLLDEIETLLDFFGESRVDELAAIFRASYKPRKSCWKEEPKEIKEGLRVVYGDFRKWWLSLDSKMILRKNG